MLRQFKDMLWTYGRYMVIKNKQLIYLYNITYIYIIIQYTAGPCTIDILNNNTIIYTYISIISRVGCIAYSYHMCIRCLSFM